MPGLCCNVDEVPSKKLSMTTSLTPAALERLISTRQGGQEADQENLKSKQTTGMKNRWTEKERRVTAKKMAELTIAGQTVNLNKYFSNFTDRTVEAVKGQQSKNAIYKALVTEYLETLPQLGEPQPVAFQVADPQENLNVPDPEHDLNECIRQYLLTQQPLLKNERKTHRLGRVCEDLRNRNITQRPRWKLPCGFSRSFLGKTGDYLTELVGTGYQ